MAIIAGSLTPVAASAHEGPHEVLVQDFAFTPRALQVDPNETVTWTVREDGHTITSKDGLFDWSVKNGDTHEHHFDTPGSFGYFCKIHPGMTGTIQVGDPVTPCLDCPSETRVVPSTTFPTIYSAVEGAPSSTTVELRPGTYDIEQTLVMSTPGLTIQGVNEDGTPADPSSVVLKGRNGTGIGIAIEPSDPTIKARPVSVQNLTVTGFLDAGIQIRGERRFRIENVRAVNNVEYGVRALGARGGSVTASYFSGHRQAGLSLEACESCDMRVERVTSENNFIGLLGENAGSLVIRGSSFLDNASGIVLRSVSGRTPHVQQGAHIYGNELVGNSNSDAPSRSMFALDEALSMPVGAGIWIQGGWYDVIENNNISGSHYGVVVTGSTVPSYGGRISDNFVSGNVVDLGWDGLGADVCFSNNGEVLSEPARIGELYGCGGGPRAGVPYPKVTADLAAYAIRNYYCHELDERTCI
jgi:plastocyanin